ncbi:MAG: PAS domain-containing protein, partial [Bacteroidota bacterium]|nr:PAS domain-containing protein [Bacteroidota bacterium]
MISNGVFSASGESILRDFDLLSRALDASLSGIIITDHQQPDNPIIYCNQAFEKITGYTRSEIIGHNCRFLQKEDRDQTARSALRNAVERGEACAVEIRNYRKDGTLFWNELYMSPVKDKAGNIQYFIGVQNDITRRKKAELDLLYYKEQIE